MLLVLVGPIANFAKPARVLGLALVNDALGRFLACGGREK
jgi:hypothetical protein